MPCCTATACWQSYTQGPWLLLNAGLDRDQNPIASARAALYRDMQSVMDILKIVMGFQPGPHTRCCHFTQKHERGACSACSGQTRDSRQEKPSDPSLNEYQRNFKALPVKSLCRYFLALDQDTTFSTIPIPLRHEDAPAELETGRHDGVTSILVTVHSYLSSCLPKGHLRKVKGSPPPPLW